ncbi:Tetracycline resistance protein from transposon Tn4351/Tn4400 [Beauveria bassiana]|uniref:Tetracycline resistance protein from transposon Tn4351/Tn4400 n=1 Tax=Beauveria bassiana TaxID=176275 RepID=A0A2N6NFY5_BEABA|nr:Tetracycline resistance protein from transposon Tn4351/Tn4400 [Beauveria bassiana]
MPTAPSSCHVLSNKAIFVIGAGISGSAFVASLRAIWDHEVAFPQVTVFDRESRDQERCGGYSLSLVGHDVSGGLVALSKMGLLDDVLRNAVAGVDGDGTFKMWSTDWKELAGRQRAPISGIPTSSVRISRNKVRRILLEAAQLDKEDAVQWNSRCISVSKLPTGRMALKITRCEDDEARVMECDLVVVADGANSKIRAQLRPTDPLEYTGAVMRTGVSRFPGPLPEQIGRSWGFVLSGTGTSCFVSPVGEKDLQWAVGHLEDKTSGDITDLDDATHTIQKAAELGSKIDEPFKTILSLTDPATVMRMNAHDKLPFRHSGFESMPVIFIGDCNHALSPFAGYGANLGLNDAWDLAEQLVKGKVLAKAIEAYDDISFPRANKIVTRARKMLRAGHSTGLRYFVFLLVLAISRTLHRILKK